MANSAQVVNVNPSTNPDFYSSQDMINTSGYVPWTARSWDDPFGHAAEANYNAQKSAEDIVRQERYRKEDFDYNTFMENTRYQRLVEDLKKAGLNPWLAVQSMTASPGSSSSVGNGSVSAKSYQSKKTKGSMKDLFDMVSSLMSSASSLVKMMAGE